MKALVIGATGAVGKDLVEQLLKDDAFERVEVFVRREVGVTSPRLISHRVDFDRLETWASLLTGDVLFSCLGTTIKAAGSQEALNAIGLMRSWKPMPTEEVAQAMIRLAKADLNGTRTYDLKSKL